MKILVFRFSFLSSLSAVIFLTFVMVAVSSRAAVRTLTLSDALGEAQTNSPNVQRAASVEREASGKTLGSWSAFLPKLSLSTTYLTLKEYAFTDLIFGGAPVSVPNVIPTSVFSADAQWNLFDGFASIERLSGAHYAESAAQHQKAWTDFQTEQQITLQFYRAIGSKILVEVAQQNLKTLEDHLRDVELFKKVGNTTSFDVLRVEVQVSEARSDLLKAQDEVYLSRQALAELMGRDAGGGDVEEVQGDLPAPNSSWINKIDATGVLKRADLVAEAETVESLREFDKAASSHWFPRVSAFGQYEQYNNRNDRYDDQSNYREAYTVGLTLTWNLFDGFADQAQSIEAIEKRVQAEKTLRMAQLHSGQEFETLKRKYLYACSVYQSRSGDIDKSTESVRLAKEGQKVGVRTNTELLDAESDLFRARAGSIHAQLESLEALINLELVTQKRYFDR